MHNDRYDTIVEQVDGMTLSNLFIHMCQWHRKRFWGVDVEDEKGKTMDLLSMWRYILGMATNL
jgi:hypothetical protein